MATANGTDTAPGVITRVFDNGLVNVAVFQDAQPGSHPATSLTLYETEADARDAIAAAKEGHLNISAAYWPPRV